VFWKSKRFEQWAPIVLAGGAILLCIVFRNDIASRFQPGKWNAGNLYNAVFNWAAIQSGFVFGIYGYIAAKRDGFVGEFAKGGSYNRFIGYTQRAYIGGFVLTFCSLPLLVATPNISSPGVWTFWAVIVWFAAFVWAFCAFLRVAFIFGLIAAVPDRPKKLAG
jgi:hypothetical protein